MTDRSDLIDTVARAIYVADDPLSRNWCDFRRMARAAIDAHIAWQHLEETLRRETSEVEMTGDD